MKAMAIMEYGGPEALQVREMAEPEPAATDLLVEVKAAGLNPVDYKIRGSGLGQDRAFPLVLGYDVCGVVRGMGESVEGFVEGDVIYASPSLARNGSNAEFVCLDYRTAAKKPESLGVTESAGLPLVTLTAWEALYDRVKIEEGQTVLIHAGGGGVGHIAIQLAKLRGCRVITTASRDESLALCKHLGADVTIDYGHEDVAERVKEVTGGKGCAVIFDTVGDAVFEQSFECLAVNGDLVTICYTETDKIMGGMYLKNATLHFEFMGIPAITGINIQHQGDILREAAKLVDAGKLKVHVGKTYRLEEVADAHRQQESGHTTGKIVLTVKE